MVGRTLSPDPIAASTAAKGETKKRTKPPTKRVGLGSLERDACDNAVKQGEGLFRFTPSSALKRCAEQRLHLEDLDLDYFNVIFGSASGPRSFVSSGFEKRMLQLAQSPTQVSAPKWLVGASTGALRFLAFLTHLESGQDATMKLHEKYCEMHYKPGDTPQVLRPLMEDCYSIAAPHHHIDALIHHPRFRIAIIVSHLWFPFGINWAFPDWLIRLYLILIALLNFLSPHFLPFFFSRVVFFTGKDEPTFLADGLGGPHNTRFAQLTRHNLHTVLHATTCIPTVQEACLHIPGVGAGYFVDGGFTDFSLNTRLPANAATRGLLLHDEDTPVRATVLDTYVPGRAARAGLFEQCSVVQPSRDFVERLPDKRLPGVGDWFDKRYIREPHLRRMNWREVYELSQEGYRSLRV